MSDIQKKEPASEVGTEWQTMLQKNIDVLKEASGTGDTFRITVFRQNLDTNAAQHAQLFVKHMTLNDDASTSTGLVDLQNSANTAADDTRKYADVVQDDLQKFSKTSEGQSADPEAWKNTFNKSIDKAKADSAAMWERARTTGIDKIQQMPPAQRNGAASVYSQALGAVASFVSNIGDWLNGALAKVWDFLKGVWDKIVGFGKQIAGWASGAFNSIKSFFGGIFSNSLPATDMQSSMVSSSPAFGMASAGPNLMDDKMIFPPWWPIFGGPQFGGPQFGSQDIEKRMASFGQLLALWGAMQNRAPMGEAVGTMGLGLGNFFPPWKIIGDLLLN